MEYEQIKKLMEDMGNSKLADVSIEFPNGIKISMKKDNANEIIGENNATYKIINSEMQMPKENNASEAKSCEEIAGNIVKSPMVGTFYSKPSPDSNSYVHVGQHVKKGDVLCIIEAMKLLNEIESEFDGEIKEILINDGEMVDFGKPLFKIV
jgi:acetyl-CoA carboxylase biotin carboxyl carrier protein